MAVEIVHELSQESLTLNQLVERMSTSIAEVVVAVEPEEVAKQQGQAAAREQFVERVDAMVDRVGRNRTAGKAPVLLVHRLAGAEGRHERHLRAARLDEIPDALEFDEQRRPERCDRDVGKQVEVDCADGDDDQVGCFVRIVQ